MQEILKNHILHLLQKDSTPRRLAQLEQELGIGADLRPAFRQAIDALSAEGSIIIGTQNLIKLPTVSSEITGFFRANPRGYGFIAPQQSSMEGDVFIPANSTGSAMTGDRVVAKVVRSSDEGRLTGKIVKVLERAHTTVVGTLRQEQTGWSIQPDGGDFTRPIQTQNVDARVVRHGDKVAVEILSYPTRSEAARGVITEVLGRPGRFEAEVSGVIQRHHLCEAFDSSSLVEASNAKTDFNPRSISGRQDITGDLVITIDPPDAKDFDDAVSLTRDEHEQWVLGVHIADVSHFVPEGSALDRCARQRGNSVYLPGKTLPMLPEMLSNGICSLQPDQRRCTKSVWLTYNKDGDVQATRFANTMIKSRARLTYQEADRILKGDPCGFREPVIALLRAMETLARIIEERRRRAGMIQLQTFASELVMDESGQAVGVQPEDTSYPHTIIEMFMVEANVAVASLLDRHCIPFMRRIHPDPDPAALRRLSQTLRLLGVTFPRQPQRSDFQRVLDQMRNTRNALPVNLLVLRSLERATYAPVSVGHYALAAPKYCHFTSPIRRYADLLVHRALDAYLAGDLDLARQQYAFPELVSIGEHISQTEQDAEDAVQELRAILILHLLHRQIGLELTGVVVSLNSFGASVHLPDYGVEGLIRREALGPDHWQYDEQNQCLIGRHTKVVLRLGQVLRVRIAEVRPAAGQLDLAPAVDIIARMPRRSHQSNPGPRNSRKSRRSQRRR